MRWWGMPSSLLLDGGHGDARLDLGGSHAGGLDDHLDLGGRYVGKGVDWQAVPGGDAGADQEQRGNQHQQALGEGKLDQAGKHLGGDESGVRGEGVRGRGAGRGHGVAERSGVALRLRAPCPGAYSLPIPSQLALSAETPAVATVASAGRPETTAGLAGAADDGDRRGAVAGGGAGFGCDEDPGLVLVTQDGAAGHLHRGLGGVAQCEVDGGGLAGAQGLGAVGDEAAQQHALAGRIDCAAHRDQLAAGAGRGNGERRADLGPGGDGQRRLDLHRQRIEPGDAVQRRGLLDALAHAHVLLEHVAGDRRDQGERLPAAVLGEGEFLAALGGLGGALGRVGAAGLQARFGDQAFAKELFVAADWVWRARVAWESAWMRSRCNSSAWGLEMRAST
jgi:hypothetical protein